MTEQPSTADERALDALTKVLESALSPEMTAAQLLILRRLSTAGDLFPSRVPAPLNITQVGGYLNLVADDPVLSAQVLASALGVAGPNPTPGFDPPRPPRELPPQLRVHPRPRTPPPPSPANRPGPWRYRCPTFAPWPRCWPTWPTLWATPTRRRSCTAT